jgi:hypothetical protein
MGTDARGPWMLKHWYTSSGNATELEMTAPAMILELMRSDHHYVLAGRIIKMSKEWYMTLDMLYFVHNYLQATIALQNWGL